jgi:hypothetical protein
MTTPRSIPARRFRPDAFQSLRAASLIVQVLLAVWLPFCIVTIVFGFDQRELLTRFGREPLSVSYAELITDQHRADAVNVAFVVLLVTTGAAFLAWFWRAYRNLEALGLRTRYTTGWALGGWFVPFLNLVRPKQLTDDLWGAVTAACSGEQDPPGGSVLLGFWWASWLGALIAIPLAIDQSDDHTVEQLLATNGWYLARAGLFIVAALLAFFVVRAITRAQQELLATAGSR